MRDLFDDFMEELRRREAAARGEDPGPDRSRDREPTGATDEADEEADDTEASESVLDSEDTDDSPDDADSFPRPRSLDDARHGGSRRPPGRGPGGPNDGGPGRAARTGRRLGLYVIVAAIIAVCLLFSVGIDLWTDALWFHSVGFDPGVGPGVV